LIDEIEKARCRSAIYQALAWGLARPDRDVQQKLASAAGRRKLGELLDTLGLPGELDYRTGERSLLERYEQLLGQGVDRVCIECEFMAFLSTKEAYSLEIADRGTFEEVRKLQALFLRDHLGRHASVLGAQLERADGDDFYGELGGLLRRFVEAECAGLKVIAEAPSPLVRSEEGDQVLGGTQGL